jgi:hypothetical protein
VELAPGGNPDRVGVRKHRGTAPVDEVDPLTGERVSHSPLVVHVVGDTLGAGQGSGDVDLRSGAAQAESLPGLRVAHQPGGASERAHRRRTSVQAGASDLRCFDQCDVGAELARMQRRGHARRAAAEDQQPHGDTRDGAVDPR